MEFVYPRNTLRELRSSFNMCPCFPDRIGIWQCWFLRRGENRSTRRKTSRSKERTNNKLNQHMTPGIDPGHIGGRRVLSPLRHPCSPKKMHGKLQPLEIFDSKRTRLQSYLKTLYCFLLGYTFQGDGSIEYLAKSQIGMASPHNERSYKVCS